MSVCYKLFTRKGYWVMCGVHDCKRCTSFACRWLKVWIENDTNIVLSVNSFGVQNLFSKEDWSNGSLDTRGMKKAQNSKWYKLN